LTITDYGTWGLISGLYGYIVVIEPIMSYWATREIARGIESGKTAMFSSGIFSIVGVLVYIVIASLVSHHTNVNPNDLFFAAILIPFIFINRTLTAINMGWKPHTISYGILSLGIGQTFASIIFVYYLKMGVPGVILSLLTAYALSIVVLAIYGREKIVNELKFSLLRKWLKLFWIPLYPGIAALISAFDVVVFSTITGAVIGLAFWSAAMVVSLLVTNAGLISRAVYSKLLGGGDREHVEGNLTQVFYFALLLSGVSIAFAKPALFTLNPIYEIAAPVVIIATVYVFFNTINAVFQSILMGVENVDENENSSTQHYLKSKLFSLPTLSLIQSCCYIGLLTVGVFLLYTKESTLNLVIYWSVIALVTSFPFTIYLYSLVRRNSMKIDFSSIAKYLGSSVGVFGLLYFFEDKLLVYTKNVFQFVPELILLSIAGIVAYITITYVLDLRTRKLFKSILNEIRGNAF